MDFWHTGQWKGKSTVVIETQENIHVHAFLMHDIDVNVNRVRLSTSLAWS